MTPIVPRVAIFSHSQPLLCKVNTEDIGHWFAKGFEIHTFTSPVSSNILVNNRFNLLVFVGNTKSWIEPRDNNLPCIFVEHNDDITGQLLYEQFIEQSLSDQNPPISLFTPAYKTFQRFDRLYNSLLEQSISNWEWIILDDSPGNENYDYMKSVVRDDFRVKIYKPSRCDGFVGSTKRQAASLCSGEYIMEVDHDDELHHLALELCLSAFKKFPDAGFCFSDSCEIFEDGGNVEYGEHFGMLNGIHYDYWYKGRHMRPANVPINASTMRHIVGVPNHFRCWKRDLYNLVGRHNNKLSVVDDYELLVRTFLKTKMIHIPIPLYFQYMNSGGNNTQEPRRAEIQRMVSRIQRFYDRQIHDRVIELGGLDWLWSDKTQQSDLGLPIPYNMKRTNLAYEYKI